MVRHRLREAHRMLSRSSSSSTPAPSTANLAVGITTAVAIVILTVFAVQLSRSQSTARHDVEDRFRARAAVTSALTDAVFSSTASSADAIKRYGGLVVPDRTLERAATEGHLTYTALIDMSGRLIASSSGLNRSA